MNDLDGLCGKHILNKVDIHILNNIVVKDRKEIFVE